MKIFNQCYAEIKRILLSESGLFPISIVLLISEIILCSYIIFNISYTEIDWIAYIEQVKVFLNGTFDYDLFVGQTGPCVYPAGHIYIYSFLYYLSNHGQNIFKTQIFFIIVYIISLCLVFNIYRKWKRAPPFILVFMSFASYRIHSIFLLRLFNDPLAMVFLYSSVNCCLVSHFSYAAILFSIAVSIKMNILLFAPGLLFVFLQNTGIFNTIGHLAECAIVQLILGSIFLFRNTEAYLGSAFEFSRQFMYKWTVNWKLLPEILFLDRQFHALLLILHLVFVFVFLVKFIRSRGGLGTFMHALPPPQNLESKPSSVNPEDVIYPMFVANFVGIAFSRSLHYQFYVWYYHTIPFLLWSVPAFSNPFRLLVFGLIEMAWNVYPSTAWSSATLHACHFTLLLGMLVSSLNKDSKTSYREIPEVARQAKKRNNQKKVKQN